jgi:hypothetical protein
MDLQDAMDYVESVDFSVRVGVASGLDTFTKVIADDTAVKALLDREFRLRIAERVLELSREPFDDKYENPNDFAVATYLWVLQQISPPVAVVCAKAGLMMNTFWVRRIAYGILELPDPYFVEIG